jgi:hypothetical protein
MAITPKEKPLTEEEMYLISLIQDNAGIDLAELLWEDPMASNKEQIFRCWDFQYKWWRDDSTQVIDQCARAIGKTASIIARAWVFPIQHPGAEMVVTAPEAVHLQPLTSRIEDRIKSTRLTRELLPGGVGRGFKHRPFQVDFMNGAKILGRIPQRDGKGVKGLHPLRLEMDEAQDFPTAGWIELVETLKHGDEGAQWRAHGVSRGVHDEFYRHSQPGSGWSVHRVTGMSRPNWDDEERTNKIEAYGSRDSPDYKRNILGLHGDATNPLFVLHRLMACVDDNLASEYNDDWYYVVRLSDEMMLDGSTVEHHIDFPGSHKKWTETWVGMDVGLTSHPSELLIFGEEKMPKVSETGLRLLTRLNLQRISAADQRRVVQMIFDFYNPRRFAMDRGGLGLPVYQDLQAEMPDRRNRMVGYTADEKIVVGWDDHETTEDSKDFEIRARVKEYGYDMLRQYVDTKRLILPWDQELLGEWQGSTWYRERSETNPYGKKAFNRGSFHSLDAGAMMIVGKEQMVLDAMVKMKKPEPVDIVFA